MQEQLIHRHVGERVIDGALTIGELMFFYTLLG